MLKVVSSPIIYSVTDSDVSNVSDSGVEWSQPPGGATVTGYVVHYSHGVDNMTENAPVSSTNLSVSDLCSGFIYIFSVEATSVHLSGESPASTIAVGGPSDNTSVTSATEIKSSEQNVFAVGVPLAVIGVCVGIPGFLFATIQILRSKRMLNCQRNEVMTEDNQAYGVSPHKKTPNTKLCQTATSPEAEYEIIPF